MELVELGKVCEIIAGQSPPSSTYNQNKQGLPFFQGKADFGRINPTVRYWCTQPKKISIPNDILFSVRAPVGSTNINNIEASIGRGLSAIRCGKKIDLKFLLHYLRGNETKIANLGTGSTFKAITIKTLKSIKIPLPPLAEQKRIAGILDEADQLRQLNKQLITKYEQLSQSLFLEMFGDPVTNPKGWEKVKFKEVGKLDRGKSKHRPRNAPELLGGKYPLIQTGDVANSGGYITEYKSTYSEIGLAQSRMWNSGTLCITIAANIAKTGILTFDACFPDSVVGFIPNEKTNVVFTQFWMSFLQKILEESAPESAQKNINLSILRNLDFVNPSLQLQTQFADRIQLIEQQKQQAQEALQKSEDLFNALLQKAFKGGL